MSPLDQAIFALAALRAELDAELLTLSDRLPALTCSRGCCDCCDADLTVFEIEAEVIRSHHSELLAHGTPGPQGRCAFLGSSGECRIYLERPYVCRTHGLPFLWYEETEAGEILEERDICPKNLLDTEPLPSSERHTKVHLPTLPESDFWLLGPYEERLSAIQGQLDHEQYDRVPLRKLFLTQEK